MSRPARVVWISCVAEKGGAEVTMLNTFRVLDRAKFRPGVILLRPGPLEADLREIDAAVWVLRQHRMREVHRVAQAILQICRLIRRERIDVIHSNGFRAHVYGGLAAALAGVPEVWTNHTVEQDTFANSAICCIPTAQIIANCTRTEEHFRVRGFSQVQTVWQAVNVERLDRHTTRSELAAKYSLPSQGRWVSVGARLQRYKGQIEFLHALASLPQEAGVHGIVIGGSLFGQESDYERELRTLVRELKLADRVTFTGFIPDADVAGLLAASELVVHPAHDEDFGLTVAEAQALGVPVLSFATFGPSVIVEHGRTGWIVPLRDQTALNAGLAEALRDPARLTEFGAAGRERARRLFHIDRHVRETEAVYERVLAAART